MNSILGEAGTSGKGDGQMQDTAERRAAAIEREHRTVCAGYGRLLSLVAAADEQQDGLLLGYGGTAALLSAQLRLARPVATNMVNEARGLRRCPNTRTALEEGRITPRHLAQILTGVKAVAHLPHGPAQAEEILLTLALHQDAAAVKTAVAGIKQALDPIGTEKEHQSKRARSACYLSPMLDGMWDLAGTLDPESGAMLATALDALATGYLHAAEATARIHTPCSAAEAPTDISTPCSTTEKSANVSTSRSTTEKPADVSTHCSTSKEPTGTSTLHSTAEEPATNPTPHSTTKKPANVSTSYSTNEKPADVSTHCSTSKEPTNASTFHSTAEEPANVSTPCSTDEKPTNTSTHRPITVEPTDNSNPHSTAKEPTDISTPYSIDEEPADISALRPTNAQQSPIRTSIATATATAATTTAATAATAATATSLPHQPPPPTIPTPSPSNSEHLTGPQRRALALTDLAARALTAGEVGIHGGVRPHLSVLIPENVLHPHRPHHPPQPTQSPHQPAPTHPQNLATATTAYGHALPPSTALRLACDCALTPIRIDDEGLPLNVGRTQRLATTAQRKALAVRDKGCTHPGCRIGPQWCDAHHLISWLDGGLTNLDNLVLLCRRHHSDIHYQQRLATLTTQSPASISTLASAPATTLTPRLISPTPEQRSQHARHQPA